MLVPYRLARRFPAHPASALAACLLLSAWCVLLAGLAPTQSWATAQSLLLDPSIRSAGMGRAGVAVLWGDDPNDWANPALLGYRQGAQFEWADIQLVPDLADDVSFSAKRWSVAWYGIGLRFAGDPIGAQRLSYGMSEATDENGYVIGEYESYEEIETIGLGVSVGGVIRGICDLAGGEAPGFLRRVDLAAGHAWNSVTVQVSPGPFYNGYDYVSGKAEATDFGALLRITPYNSLDRADGLPGMEQTLRGSLEIGLAYAERGYNEDTIQEDQLPHTMTGGVSLHLAVTSAGAAAENRPWIYDLVSPLLSVGATWERSQPRYGGEDAGNPFDRWGVEIVAANFLTFRYGGVDGPTGAAQDNTSGWGVGARYGRIAGVRYDRADVPQSTYLERNGTPEGVTAFVDPIALWGKLR